MSGLPSQIGAVVLGSGDEGANVPTDIELLRAELLAAISSTADELRVEMAAADAVVLEDSKTYADGLISGLPTAANWLLSTFDGATRTFTLLESDDGINWSSRPNQPYYPWAVRDPSIIRYRGKWYMAHTGASGSGSPLYSARGFWISSSDDLESWSVAQTVDVKAEIQDVTQVWAPEWFIDPATGLLHAFFSVQRNNGTFSIYEKHQLCDYLSGWSAARLVTITGQNTSVIDPFMVFRDGTYYLWYKAYTSTSYNHYAISSSLLGPYQNVRTGDWAGWGNVEGVCVVRMDDRWRAYMDDFQFSYDLGQLNYSDSFDDWNTWTARQPIVTPSQAKHGTVIRI